MTASVIWFGGGASDDAHHDSSSRRQCRIVPANGERETNNHAALARRATPTAHGKWTHLDTQAKTEAWLNRIRDGDERALEQMVHACYAPVASVARRYAGSRELAEEVTQDVFVRIWEHRAHIEVSGGLMAYLFGAVRHRALNATAPLRERAPHLSVDDGLGTAQTGTTPELWYDAAETSHALRIAVDRLAPRGREVFLLSRRDGLTPAQIASVLGINVQTVYTLLARALQELQRAIDALS